MKLPLRIYVVLLSVSVFPIFILLAFPGPGGPYLTAVGVLVAVTAGAGWMIEGIGTPLARMLAAVKAFRKADYRLDDALPKTGWPETAELVSSLNRLMLELGAYRAFHINQMVEERAKAQALIDTISDAVILVDDRGRLIHCNKLALNLLRVDPGSHDIVLPDSAGEESFRAALQGILSSQENHARAEVNIPCPEQSGDPRIARNYRLISNQFLLAALKRPGRVIAIRDITAEKEMESARETFFHMITHDMRTPLASIQGYAQLMTNCLNSPEKMSKYLGAIAYSSERLNCMIEDILNTIKLERGDMPLLLDKVDPKQLCGRVLEVYEPIAERKGVRFSVRPPDDGMSFRGDARLLERVICNLVGNSLKFTPRGGAVALSCCREGGGAVFSVADNGPGIPKDKHNEIFGKYAQLEEHKYMGFGLGLAMCKMAVELHGGRIWVDSEEGKGSRFSFTLPGGGTHV